jgi:hypothetical protein
MTESRAGIIVAKYVELMAIRTIWATHVSADGEF